MQRTKLKKEPVFGTEVLGKRFLFREVHGTKDGMGWERVRPRRVYSQKREVDFFDTPDGISVSVRDL